MALPRSRLLVRQAMLLPWWSAHSQHLSWCWPVAEACGVWMVVDPKSDSVRVYPNIREFLEQCAKGQLKSIYFKVFRI